MIFGLLLILAMGAYLLLFFTLSLACAITYRNPEPPPKNEDKDYSEESD